MARIDGSSGLAITPGPETGEERQVGKGNITPAEPQTYLQKLESQAGKPVRESTALRERVTLVIPPEKVIPKLTNNKAKDIPEPETTEVPSPLPENIEEHAITESSVSAVTDSVPSTETAETERAQTVYDEYNALVVATNQFIEKKASVEGEVVHLDRNSLQETLSNACRELGIPDLSLNPESMALFEKYIATRLERKGIEVVPYETQEAVITFGDPGVDEGQEAERLLQGREGILNPEVNDRPAIEAAAMPGDILKIKEFAMEVTDYADLAKAQTTYYKAVIDYCKQNYGDGPVPPELQEAFYKGMVELGVQGYFLDSLHIDIKGSSRLKPKNKLRLAMEAAIIDETRRVRDEMPEGMIGSAMSNLTKRSLIADRKDADYLFGHCMGFELASSRELSAPLKKTFRNLEQVTKELETAPEGSEQKAKLEERRALQLEAISTTRQQMDGLESRRAAGVSRGSEDLWKEAYALLERRMMEHLEASVEKFHKKARSSKGKAGFLSGDTIFNRLRPQLKRETERAILARVQKSEITPELREQVDQKMQEKENQIKAILREAINPVKRRVNSRK